MYSATKIHNGISFAYCFNPIDSDSGMSTLDVRISLAGGIFQVRDVTSLIEGVLRDQSVSLNWGMRDLFLHVDIEGSGNLQTCLLGSLVVYGTLCNVTLTNVVILLNGLDSSSTPVPYYSIRPNPHEKANFVVTANHALQIIDGASVKVYNSRIHNLASGRANSCVLLSGQACEFVAYKTQLECALDSVPLISNASNQTILLVHVRLIYGEIETCYDRKQNYRTGPTPSKDCTVSDISKYSLLPPNGLDGVPSPHLQNYGDFKPCDNFGILTLYDPSTLVLNTVSTERVRRD
jgi:hypothetical protein